MESNPHLDPFGFKYRVCIDHTIITYELPSKSLTNPMDVDPESGLLLEPACTPYAELYTLFRHDPTIVNIDSSSGDPTQLYTLSAYDQAQADGGSQGLPSVNFAVKYIALWPPVIRTFESCQRIVLTIQRVATLDPLAKTLNTAQDVPPHKALCDIQVWEPGSWSLRQGPMRGAPKPVPSIPTSPWQKKVWSPAWTVPASIPV